MDASDIMTLIGSAQGVGQITSLLTTISKAKLICKEKRPFSLNFVPGNELEFQFVARLQSMAARAFSMLLDETEYRGSLTAVAALLPMSGLGGLAGFLFQNKSNTLAAMQQLYQLTMPHVEVKDKKSGKGFWRPPLVVFKWGDFAFSGVVDDLDFEMLVFDTDGNPRRVMVDVTLKGRGFENLSTAKELLEIMSDDEFNEMATRQKNAAVVAGLQSSLSGGGSSGD